MFPSPAAIADPGFSARPPSPATVPLRSAGSFAATHPFWTATTACTLSVAGLAGIAPTALVLWQSWLDEPTKSIGALVLPVCLVLILRAWVGAGRPLAGSWWGLVLLAATMLMVRLRQGAVCELVLSPSFIIALPPFLAIAVLYTAGVVLLFGGPRLLRAARFPVLFAAAVNPVPNFVLHHLDLPLQHVSAHIARSFAHAVGAPLGPGQLRLMFTPEFGMFIAPGCDGIRGAVTMGLLALVAGHWYRFRALPRGALVLGGVALGYVFNLLRLCALVLYYLLALRRPWLQDHAEGADYLLGGCLFFAATFLLFQAVRHWRQPPVSQSSQAEDTPPRAVRSGAGSSGAGSSGIDSRPFGLHAVAMAALVVVAAAPYLREAVRGPAKTPASMAALFPQRLGEFQLRRTWMEELNTGVLVYHWAEYATATGTSVSVGVSPLLGAHDALLCHLARGENWLWRGDLPVRVAGSAGSVSFNGALYNDGVTQLLEAGTLCSGDTCGEHNKGPQAGRSGSRAGIGLIYSHIGRDALLGRDTGRPVPLLLKVESLDLAEPPDAARMRLTGVLQTFMGAVDPVLLVRSAR